MSNGKMKCEPTFAGKCVIHGCGRFARAWNQWQRALFMHYGPVCERCQPFIVARLLSRPDQGRLRIWCEAIEERAATVQSWRSFYIPKVRRP